MSASLAQPRILATIQAHGASLVFRLVPGGNAAAALARLQAGFDTDWGVVGLGQPLLDVLGKTITGLKPFVALTGKENSSAPTTQQALWVLLTSDDRSVVFDHSEQVQALLAPDLVLADGMDTFVYVGGRDLTGYEDGTENPTGEDAVEAALSKGQAGLAGSSFVAVQRWLHDLAGFNHHSLVERNHMIGRDRDSNEELEDAPETAHVKRTAQEDYDPPAFMVRRSMPWTAGDKKGLEFIAFGHSLQAFEQVLTRMLGLEDGVVDALFRFSRPVTGGYYWCPPLRDGKLDLTLLD